MSAPYEFSIPRRRMIWLAVCVASIQLLLYGAGIATGIIIRSAPPAPKVTEPEKQTAVQPARAPEAPASQVPATAQATETPKPATAEPAPTEHSPTKPAAPTAPHLVVQVASFHEKDSALKLAALLKREGFGNVTVGEYQNRTEDWHFVSLGPFHEWEEASRVAAELDRSWDLHAWVRPVHSADN